MQDPTQSRANPILAAGEILWDLLPSGARLGGTTANFALGCARLGRLSALISCVGSDEAGQRARDVLAGFRAPDPATLLDTSLIQTSGAAPTGVVDVTVGPDGHPAYTIACPAAWDEIRCTTAARSVAKVAPAFCFGTLAQRAEPSRSSIRDLVLATSPGCLRVLDVNVRLPFFSEDVARWSLAHASVVKISEEELDTVARAAGVPGLETGNLQPAPEQMERCIRAMLAAYPNVEIAAVTMGSRGSLLIGRAETHYHAGIPTEVRDTVGAGDAFTAGLVHGLLAGASLAGANEVGNLCGSYVASQPGATPVFPPELLERVEAVVRASGPVSPVPANQA
jgi:fructokinase